MTQSDPLINHIKPENILGVEYKPLYRLLARLEDEKEVVSDKSGRFNTKVYFLENEWKTKMENDKPLLINGNHSENSGNEKSFSKTRNSGKLNEKVESGSNWEPEDETIDPWDED